MALEHAWLPKQAKQSLEKGAQRVANDWCLLSTKNNSSQRRIKKRHDFLRIQRTGRRFKAAFVVLISKFTKEVQGRVGFTVPKNVSKKAVDRNLIKRRLRHISRENSHMFETKDLIVLALPSSIKASFQELKKDVERAYEGLRKSLRSGHRPRVSRSTAHSN